MKITAGMGSVDEYVSYVKAGADEVFCGYVPASWNARYGNITPLNRREVLFVNVNIGTISDMEILAGLVDAYKVPVAVAFNSPFYLPEQYEIIAGYIRDLMTLGFRDFIIADLAFLVYLKSCEDIAMGIRVHLSGEFAELNRESLGLIRKDFGGMISRVIFGRKNTLGDMERCIEEYGGMNDNGLMEFEAFIYNEKCHFSGGFCSSIHSDEMVHMCQMRYELKRMDGGEDEVTCRWEEMNDDVNDTLTGSEGDACGLCALRKLQEYGVTHLKVVGRGKSEEAMAADIRRVKQALVLTEESEENINIRKELFGDACGENCYF